MKFRTLAVTLASAFVFSTPSYAFFGSGLPSDSDLEKQATADLSLYPGWKVVDVDSGKEMPINKEWLSIHQLGQALGSEKSEIKQYHLDVEVEFVGNNPLLAKIGVVDDTTYLTSILQPGDKTVLRSAFINVDYSDSDDEFFTIVETKTLDKMVSSHRKAQKDMQNGYYQVVDKSDLDDVVEKAEQSVSKHADMVKTLQGKLDTVEADITRLSERKQALYDDKKQQKLALDEQQKQQSLDFKEKDKVAYNQSLDENKAQFNQLRDQLKAQANELKSEKKATEKALKAHIKQLHNDAKLEAKAQINEVKAKYKQQKSDASDTKKESLSALKAEEKSLLNAKKESLDKDAYKVAREQIKADFKARKESVNAQYKQAVEIQRAQQDKEIAAIELTRDEKREAIDAATYSEFTDKISLLEQDLEINDQDYDASRQDEKARREELVAEFRAHEKSFNQQLKQARDDFDAKFKTEFAQFETESKALYQQKKTIRSSKLKAQKVVDQSQRVISIAKRIQ
ncbi:hypothetical protein [Vibrio sp. LaRot3]|uniref:hypothetical protein n=1 Tax=Vibrio sp. LaRot3 TaxID=2998829 RepID=UPI0022CE0803|nr:hypothetical protein [Vibrio sp. LaRot3]MDA0147083.1 hypothetical protein [Vibrio sp. LaRot3]